MKKAFTLLELIIVVGILSLLIGSISFFIPTQIDKKLKFGKDCSNYIFQEILNEKNNIEKNKIIKSGENIFIPIKTEISGNNGISIKRYYRDNYENINNIVDDDGFCLNDKLNTQNLFTIKFDVFSILLEENTTASPNTINISACNKKREECIEISKINYNQASKKFEQKFCLYLDGNDCSKWEE